MRLLPLMASTFTFCLQTLSAHPQQPVAPAAINAAPAWPQSYPKGSETALGARITALLSDPKVSHAHWGVAVTAMDGTPIYGSDENKLFRPASTAKLFTTAAAMAILGPEYTFKTAVYGDLDPASGQVKGNLVIVGGGDPAFGTEDVPYSHTAQASSAQSGVTVPKDVASLADTLAAKGLRAVSGKIVGDDSLFATEAPPDGWAAEDLTWGYGALPSALSIADNELRLTITPQAVGDATVRLAEPVPYMRIAGRVQIAGPGNLARKGFNAQESPGEPPTLTLFGNIPPSAPPESDEIALPDSARYAAELLGSVLTERGIRSGGTSASHLEIGPDPSFLGELRAPLQGCELTATGRPVGCGYNCAGAGRPEELLAQHISAPLYQDVVFTLKTSANLHAEVLLHDLPARYLCPGVSTVQGARMVRGWLIQAGIAPDDFLFYDGSGLSTKDLVTPRAEVELLAYAARQSWFAQWKAALPVGGVDGTLESRFKDPPLKGHVFAKTGTLGETRALAGYVDCASGRQVIFSIMVDNHEPGAEDRGVMDKIVEEIAAAN